jgi:enterochelin esterase-like enzyme
MILINCFSRKSAQYAFGKISVFLLIVFTNAQISFGQTDHQHYSKTFKAHRPYRIYLPKSYLSSPAKRYPVIYYFHGNKDTHEISFAGLDSLVNKANVLLVAWNGRSRFSDDRPYNIGYHSNINYTTQFKDYFPELLHHIDNNYRTINDRAYRGVIGHSMGGFMSFFLAGKYPHLLGTAVYSKGSPEFFVGYPDNHTLYQQRHLLKNLYGVRLRFQDGETGEELVHLNKEVKNAAAQIKDLDLSYQSYPGPHDLNYEQFKDAFEFVAGSFLKPVQKPDRWHHADLYPSFNVWGYQVNSNLKEPGFIELTGVTKGGFATATRKWQPDGRSIPNVDIHIQTAPIYKPNTAYTIADFNKHTNTQKKLQLKSDANGRINFTTNYQQHYFGIYEQDGPPEIVCISYQNADGGLFLPHKKPAGLKIRLLNRGGSTSKSVKITLSSLKEGVVIGNPTQEVSSLASGELAWTTANFNVTITSPPPPDGGTPYIRFNISLTDDAGNSWKDELDALVMYDVPEFTEIGIDDGDSEIFGSGNGNNIAEPGEKIMIYQHSNRTRLYYDDPYKIDERLHDDLQPDKWGDGYALSSLIRISKDCPPGHVIRFLACYEIKEWKTIKRNVTWGTFSITVGQPPVK